MPATFVFTRLPPCVSAVGIGSEDHAVQRGLDARVGHEEPGGELRAVAAVGAPVALVAAVTLGAVVAVGPTVALGTVAVDAVLAGDADAVLAALGRHAVELGPKRLRRGGSPRSCPGWMSRFTDRLVLDLRRCDRATRRSRTPAVQTTPVMTTAAIVLYGSRSMNRVFGVLSCCMVRCLAS